MATTQLPNYQPYIPCHESSPDDTVKDIQDRADSIVSDMQEKGDEIIDKIQDLINKQKKEEVTD